MNILILHNDNLSSAYTEIKREDLKFDGHQLKLSSTDTQDFDSYVSDELSKLPLADYDVIVMPLNFTETYLEYTGLRVAAHIRLTKEWNSIATPIIFLGSDKPDEIIRFSPLGELLNTFNIYYYRNITTEHLCELFLWINRNKLNVDTDSQEYRSFLYRLRLLHAPANYATHHSIANEWAIMRWIDMLNWGRIRQPELPKSDFTRMLYFKYLKAVAGDIKHFSDTYKEKHPLHPKIDGIEGKRIVCIDDEMAKGWQALLECIFKASDAVVEFVSFEEINKARPKKDELINRIKEFILQDYQEHGGADCYLIDLRLHDDDFGTDVKYSDLSGHKVAEFIKKDLNPYSQIVIFTASNKVWNYEKAVKTTKACGYVLKETPEPNLSREDSMRIFNTFVRVVKLACNLGYLRGLYDSLKDLEADFGYSKDELALLYQFVELLNIDNNQKQDTIIKATTLTLYAFFEDFMDCRFDIGGAELMRKGRDYCTKWLGRFYVKYEKTDKNDTTLTDIKTVKDNLVSNDLRGWSKWELDSKKIGIPKKMLILIPLSLYYNIPDAGLRKVLTLIDRRNAMAHKGKGKYTLEELIEIFTDIILPIVRQEANGEK